MKIQLSDKKILKDVLTVWQEAGPSVDLVADLRKLTFAPNSLEAIYSFHVLDHLFPNEILNTLINWRECLKPGGTLFVVVDDFEFIARMIVGGDITIDEFNKNFAHPSQFSRDNLIQYMLDAGFQADNLKLWFADIPNLFSKKKYELIIEATKND